jgi:hypothetical protein
MIPARSGSPARNSTGTPPMSTTPPEATAAGLRKAVAAGSFGLDVSGRSMGKTIQAGSRVTLVLAEQPRRGEIWAFVDTTGDILVHRCIRTGLEPWHFQGDARARPDRPVTADRLVGRVAATEQDGRVRTFGMVDRVLSEPVRVAWRTYRRTRRALASRRQR